MKPLTFAGMFIILSALSVQAGSLKATALGAMDIFAENCFSPFLTSDKAAKAFAISGVAYDFYDLHPFSNVAPSPVTGHAATPNTDRRCEVSFAGDFAAQAAQAAVQALDAEGIRTPAPLPAVFSETQGTTLLAARYLNPKRIAVVHIGTRHGAQNTETFMLVERLTPAASQNQTAKGS